MLNIIGITLISFFIIFLLQKKPRITADYALILLNLLFASLLATDLWIKHELTKANFIIQNLAGFLILPTFLIYGMLLINGSQQLKKRWWWFGIYAVSFAIFLFIDFSFLNSNNSQVELRRAYEVPNITYQFFYKSHYLFVIICLFWFLRKIKHYEHLIKEHYSNIESIRLKWLERFSWVLTSVGALWFLTFSAYNLGLMSNIDVPFLIVNGSLVIALLYLILHGIRQYSIVEFYHISKDDVVNTRETKKSIPVSRNNGKGSQTNSEFHVLYKRVRKLFEEDNVYQDPELQLQNVAEKLNVNTYKLSKTINTVTRKSFYDFVNGYRVEHFKRLLETPEKNYYTILGLGLESGFNSKASLNRIFKQFTGQSPRDYQRLILKK